MATDHNFRIKNGLDVQGANATIVSDGGDTRITSSGEFRFRPEGSTSNKVRLTLNTVIISGSLDASANVDGNAFRVDGTTVIDSSRRIYPSNIQSSGSISFLNGSAGTSGTGAQGISVRDIYAGTTYANRTGAAGTIDALNGFKVAGTTVINSSRALTSITGMTSSGVIKHGSYLRLQGAGHNNTGQITLNASYGGGQTNEYTPDYAGAASAGMFVMKQNSGGNGTVNVFVKNHGTTSSAANLSTFTEVAQFNQDGYFSVPNGLRVGSTQVLSSGRDIVNIGNITASGTVLLKGANDNSGKADFAIDVGGNPQLSLLNNQVQLGSTDMNWSAKFFYDGSGGHVAVWNNDLEFFTQGSNTGSATARNIIFSPQIGGTGLATERMRLRGDDGVLEVGAGLGGLVIDSGGDKETVEGRRYNWYLMGMSTQTDYFKICTVTIGTGLYKALAMKVIVESQLGNFGNQAQVVTSEYNVTYYRSSNVQDNVNNALIYGKNPAQHTLRVMKTATGTYELQIKQTSSYRDALVKIQVLSSNGGSIEMSNGKVTGSSSGTEYTASTHAGAENLFPGKVGGKRFEGAAETSNTVPIFTFDGDEDTGLGYITSNAVGLIASGSRKFYVNNTNAYFQNLPNGIEVAAANIAIDGGNANSTEQFVIKHTGMTGNQTILEQNTASIYGRLHTTERQLRIEAGSSGGTGTAEKLSFWTNASRAMTIDTSQRVGIGTDAPSNLLHLKSSSDYEVYFEHAGSGAETFRLSHGTSGLYMRGPNTSNLMFGWTQDHDVTFYTTSGAKYFTGDGSQGFIGIGPNTPEAPLDIVVTASGIHNTVKLQNTNTTNNNGNRILFQGRDTSGNAVTYGQLLFKYTDHSTEKSEFQLHHMKNASSNQVLTITEDGRIGIEEDNPNANLHVGSSVSMGSQANPAIQIGATNNYRLGLYTTNEGAVYENKNGDDGHIFKVKTAGEAMRIDGITGKVGIGTPNPSNALHVISDDTTGAVKIARSSNQDQALFLRGGIGSGEGRLAAQYSLELRSGLSNSTAYDLKLTTASGTAIEIDAGNSNRIEFNGAYKFPTSDGSSGQVLQTNGSGQLSFATVTSGGGAVDSIANFANNRIITASDSDSLNGEANLTYDGTRLTLFTGSHSVNDDNAGFTIRQTGTYSDGRYEHRFRKRDEGGGIPLYIDKTEGTAGTHTAIARFGSYTSNPEQFEVYGQAKITSDLQLSAGLLKFTTNNHLLTTHNQYNIELRSGSGSSMGILGRNSASNFRFQIYGDGSSYGFLDGVWAGWDIKKTVNGQLQIDEGSGLNKVWTSGNDGSGSGLDADTIDGLSFIEHQGVSKQINITVDGASDKYYPVVISGLNHEAGHEVKIERGYAETAPSDWYTSTHKGGLSLRVTIAGASGWGGYPNIYTVDEFGEIYSRICGGMKFTAHTMKFVVWLRGGTATYRIFTKAANASAIVYDDTSSGYTSGSGWLVYDHSNSSYDVYEDLRDQTAADTGAKNEIIARMPVRAGGTTKANQVNYYAGGTTLSGGNLYWNDANDGSGSGLDADTLDGINSGSFLRSDTNDTFTGSLTIDSGTSMGLKIDHDTFGQALEVHREDNSNAASIKFSNNSGTSGILFAIHSEKNLYWRKGTETTNREIWHSGNDGSGSGLDADKLDGEEGSYYRNASNINAGTLSSGRMPSTPPNTYIYGTDTLGAFDSTTFAVNPPRMGFFNINNSSSENPAGFGYWQGLHFRHNNQSSTWGWQLAGTYNTSYPDLYFRQVASASRGAWYKLWHTGNDGSGSGLDADLLDGQHASAFLTSVPNHSANLITSGTVSAARLPSPLSSLHSDAVTGSALATTGSPHSVLEYQQASSISDTKLAPSGDWHNTIRMGHGNPYSYYSNTIALRMTGSGLGDLYTQTISNNNAQGWNKHWHTNNDGSGSGLDADLLDGQHASAFLTDGSIYLRSNASDTFGSTSANQYIRFNCNSGQYIASGGSSSRFPIEIFGPTTNGGDAGITFHIHNDYAGFFGLASDWNDLAWGGWSVGSSTKYRIAHTGNFSSTGIWYNGNDGSGSGLDADTLDGQHGSYYAQYNHIRSLGTTAFTSGSNPNITTAQYISEMESDGAFDSFTSVFKTSWSYAGNYNLSDAGTFGPTETAGMSHITWTDNASDTARGNITVLAIAPTTGGSAGGVYVYNDQGSGYNAGWREIWTSSTDGAGSGLDADKLDGQEGSHYLNYNNLSNTPSLSFLPLSGGTMTGTITSRDILIQAGYNLQRSDHHTGHLEGSYNNVAGNANKTNPIYTIGSNYNPASTTLSNMYGIGFSKNTASFMTGDLDTGNNSGWGLYVAADGDARIFLNATAGIINSTGQHYADGQLVWNAGNDGAGSGLDADTLDGYNSAQNGGNTIHRLASNGYSQLQNWTNVASAGMYSTTANSAHFSPNTTTSYGTWRTSGSRGGYDGIVFDTGGDAAVIFDSGGNGGFYREASSRWYMYHHVGNNCTGFSNSTTSSSYSVYVSGALYATGDVVAFSDRRAKENIITIDSALEKVNQLRGVYYNKIDNKDKEREIGFIAQEVNEVAPELITYAEDVDEYGMKYGNTTALLVEAVKELTQQVKDLKQEVEELKNG